MNDTLCRILNELQGVNRPQCKFMFDLFLTLMSFVGRATYRNLSRFSEYCETTHSRWANRDFDYPELNQRLIESELPGERETIAVIDATFLSKSGKCTEGLAKFWNGAAGKAETGLEISVLGVVDIKSNTFYTLSGLQTIDKEEDSRVIGYGNQVKACSYRLKSLGASYLVADGYYSKKKFLDAVFAEGLQQIGKLRRDANLRMPFEGPYSGKGRPRKYTDKVDCNGELEHSWKRSADLEDGTQVFSATLYYIAFKRLIQVVILRRRDEKNKLYQAILFSTYLNLDPLKIVEYYKARFQIEFTFRDAKQHTGLSDCQARTNAQMNHHINACLCTLNLLKLEDRKEKGVDDQTVISIDSWKRKKSNQLFMSKVISKLDLDVNSDKVIKALKQLESFGSIAA